MADIHNLAGKVSKSNGKVHIPKSPDELHQWFRTLDELKASPNSEVVPIWDGYVYESCLTLLAGRQKSGKSTLLLDLVEALGSEDATEFLGHEVTTTNTLVVTEENDVTLKHKASQYGHYMTRERIGEDIPHILDAVRLAIERRGARFVIIDTMSFWMKLPPKAESDSSAMNAALRPFQELVEQTHIGLLLVHHFRKGGGEEGESIRGSSAIAGIPDVLVELDRIRREKKGARGGATGEKELDNEHPTRRVLRAVGRLPGIVDELILDYSLKHRAYSVVSETKNGETVDGTVTKLKNKDKVIIFLHDEIAPVSRNDIGKALDLNPGSQVKNALDTLVREGFVSESMGKSKQRSGEPATLYTITGQGEQHYQFVKREGQ